MNWIKTHLRRWMAKQKNLMGYCINQGCFGKMALFQMGECCGCQIDKFLAEVKAWPAQ